MEYVIFGIHNSYEFQRNPLRLSRRFGDHGKESDKWSQSENTTHARQ